MKLNKILMAIAAMAMVGCSSDDVMDFTANQAPEDSRMIQLDENFAIAGVGVDNATTRTHWEQLADKSLINNFLSVLTADASAGAVLADVPRKDLSVGLCWVGQGGVPEVYTNYQFYHFGWLETGEDEATIECDKLTNGAWYDEIEFTADNAAGEADEANFGLIAAKPFVIGDLNWNSGVYKTDNKAIFGGDYIVYYPFDETFNEVGTIPAKAKTSFVDATDNKEDTYLGEATFRYSSPIHIGGGTKASGFGLRNLSALVNLKVKGNSAGVKIDKIVLWSKNEQLLAQANLDATKIVAGKTGTELYAEGSTVGAKTIVAALKTHAEVVDATDGVSTYITVLLTTVEDLVAYVHNEDGKWAKIVIGSYEFKPSSGHAVIINVKPEDFKAQYIAVDQASLEDAIAEVGTAKATIEVIGDITLENNLIIDIPKVTIKGDKIIVPEDKILTLNTKMQSDIRVLGKSCCTGNFGGTLFINGGTISNVTLVEAEAETTEATYFTYNPLVQYNNPDIVTVAAGKTFDAQAGRVIVDGPVYHKGNIKIAEDVQVTVTDHGDLNFMGSTVLNNGTIEVLKGGKYDMTDADGNATATDGQRMTSNGKFIHNVDAGVGTAVQSMVQNGEYRCKVEDQIKLDDAFLQWKACSVIEMVNTAAVAYDLGNVCQHNGKYIDFVVNAPGGTEFINPTTTPDNKVISIGNLTVLDGGFAIDFVEGDGKRTLTVNGDMTVNSNTSIRDSKKINITKNLTVEGGWLYYQGNKLNEEGLAVGGDITVIGATIFDASDLNALNITCANFYLKSGAKAEFGNRTEGDAKNLVVSGTISNPATCTFDIKPAASGNVLAWVSCKKLEVGGNWNAARPRVE